MSYALFSIDRFRAGAFALLALLPALPGAPALAQSRGAAVADLAAYAGADRTQRLIEGAKKEGTLLLYSTAPADDMAVLREQGIGRLFGPGTPTSDLIEYIESWAAQHLDD